MIQEQIASRLEQAFSQLGFAEPSVAELRSAADVSLRTLYRQFPSKESMVIGALEYRHARYLRFLTDDSPPAGRDALIHLFAKLGAWMSVDAPNGCLSVSALAAFPGNPIIRAAVNRHKQDVIELIARLSGRAQLAYVLFLLHEGASAAWPLLGEQAIQTATRTALQLFEEGYD